MSAVCARCPDPATHEPCCSSHGHKLCCQCYRTTHFVEVGPCCGQPSPPESTARHMRSLETELRELELADPTVGAASNSYERMSRELRRAGGAPEVAD